MIAGRDAEADRREAGSSGTPARRTAGGRPRPASRAGRRSGSRSGAPCPSSERDRLELGRCPRTPTPGQRSPSASAARRTATRSGDRGDRRRDPADAGVTIRASRPQMTPHRLIASDTTTRPTPSSMPQRRRTRQTRSNAERDEEQGERREVVAEPVAELDPALAEVHEVDERDRDDREDGAGDERGCGRSRRSDRDGEQVRRARQQDAHPGVARDRERAVEVEQAARPRPGSCTGWRRVAEARRAGDPAGRPACRTA